jgi:hypothetical protein
MSLAYNLPLVRYFRYAATMLGVIGTIIWGLLLFSAAYTVLLVLWVVGLHGPFLLHRLVVLRFAELEKQIRATLSSALALLRLLIRPNIAASHD